MSARDNERMMRVLQATPAQLAAIDEVLAGKAERAEQRAMRKGPLTLMIQQAAEYLGVHRATINRLMKAGKLTPVLLLGAVRVRREEVEGIAFGGKAESGQQQTEMAGGGGQGDEGRGARGGGNVPGETPGTTGGAPVLPKRGREGMGGNVPGETPGTTGETPVLPKLPNGGAGEEGGR